MSKVHTAQTPIMKLTIRNNTVSLSNKSVDKSPAVPVLRSETAQCGFCRRSHVDDVMNKLYRIGGMTVHYFCMLFNWGSKQAGEDGEGLFGFYGEEVRRQVEASQKKNCRYCNRPGGAAKCQKKHCNVSMHFLCGREHGATFQFYGGMAAFCGEHRVRKREAALPSPPDQDCMICLDRVDTRTKQVITIKMHD